MFCVSHLGCKDEAVKRRTYLAASMNYLSILILVKLISNMIKFRIVDKENPYTVFVYQDVCIVCNSIISGNSILELLYRQCIDCTSINTIDESNDIN